MKIAFHPLDAFEGWALAPKAFGELIERFGSKKILEVGSGAGPTMSTDFVRKHGLHYVTNDIDAGELEKSDPAYARLCHDFSGHDPLPDLIGAFDFVFSRMVNEHVQDGERYYRNLHQVLRPGGICAHCFSTLYTLPFLANRLMPEFISDKLLDIFAPRDRHRHGKFKAYYSWSRGPSRTMIRRFESLGFEVVEYHGYFGHPYYARRAPFLHSLEKLKSDWLVRHPVALLTSYGKVILRKR
jgi:SAM-dependent methyltransferase